LTFCREDTTDVLVMVSHNVKLFGHFVQELELVFGVFHVDIQARTHAHTYVHTYIHTPTFDSARCKASRVESIRDFCILLTCILPVLHVRSLRDDLYV
jgi:hypothetical protein